MQEKGREGERRLGAHAPNFQHILYSSLLSLKTEENKWKSLSAWLFLTLNCHSLCLVLILLLAARFVELHLSSKNILPHFPRRHSILDIRRSAARLLSSFPTLTHLGNKCLLVVCSRFSPLAWKTHLPAVYVGCGGGGVLLGEGSK